MSVRELPAPLATESEAPSFDGIVPSQGLHRALDEGWVFVEDENFRITPKSVQPASLDLRLGECAWSLRCSFLPNARSTVEQRATDLRYDEIDIRHGATLEPDRPYLIPLMEEVALPSDVRGKANPKSSTGRLDVFTRVITDYSNRFDEIAPGYHGKLYLEVVPRSFTVKVHHKLSLNQLRLAVGKTRLDDEDLRRIHSTEAPLLYTGAEPVPASSLPAADGLFLSVDLGARPDEPVGFRAKKNSRRLDMGKIGYYASREFWEPVYAESGGRIILEPEIFYLLLSVEGVCVPPGYAAEMMAYDPTAGELRTHYAGFFDPGFGYGTPHGSRAALEVRARDVPFMLEHGQAICKLAFEAMIEEPDQLYGEEVGSHYQGQSNMLSKHFVEASEDLGGLRSKSSRPLF